MWLERLDCGYSLFELFDGCLGAGRAAAEAPKLRVDLAVGQAGAVVVGADEGVELAAEEDTPFARGAGAGGLGRGVGLRGGAATLGGGDLVGLALVEQGRDLVGAQQAGEAEIFLLLGGA